MEYLKIYVMVHVTGQSDLGQEINLDICSPPVDYPAPPADISSLAADAYQTARFIVKGGTSHPVNPWSEDQAEPEPDDPPARCGCGAPLVFIDGASRCAETGDYPDSCRNDIPF